MQYVVVNNSQHIVLYHSTTYSVTVLLVNILISTFLPYLPASSNTGRSDGVVRKKLTYVDYAESISTCFGQMTENYSFYS